MNEKFSKSMQWAWFPAFALGLAIISGPTARAEIHSDFDPGGTYFGGDEGWFNYVGNPNVAIAPAPGGSTLWLAVKPNQYFGKMTSQNWAVPDITVSDWNANTHFKFDIIVDSLWIPNNSAQQVEVEFQTTGGVGGTVTQYAYPTINTSLKNVVQHVSVPLAAFQPFDPTATGWNLSLKTDPGYAWEWDSSNADRQPYNPRYYLDNIRWVPEPSAMLLLSIGVVVGAMVQRRRGA